MPNLPNVGDTNWGTTLNTFLQVSHNNDGTLKNAAGSGGITNIEVVSQSAYDALTPNSQTLYIIV